MKNVLIGVLIALILALCGVIVYNSHLKDDSDTWRHNYEVMKDSMEVVTTKMGEVLYERGSLIVEKKDLEDALGVSQKQVKEYEKSLGSKLAYISILEGQLKVKDTVKITQIIHDTLNNSYSMSYKDDWLQFDETLSLKDLDNPSLSVYNIGMNLPLKVGLTDNYTIFVQSDNPYFNISSIEGAVINGSQLRRKMPRWTLSVYGGVGVGYGFINKKIDIGPQIGIGAGFRIY